MEQETREVRMRGGRAEVGWLVLFLCLAFHAGPAAAQNDSVADRTKATRGLTWGAAVGGALGALGFGVLAAGLCDSADCDGAFFEGAVPGLLVGAASGGLAGLVVGSAFPEEGRVVGGWTWGARGGMRRAGAADISGVGPVLEAYALRATTQHTRFGLTLEYLGGSERQRVINFQTRDGQSVARTQRRGARIAGLRFVALRDLGGPADTGGYVVGRLGVHPTWEWFTYSEAGPFPESTSRSVVLAAGGGAGVGFVVPLSPGWGLDVGAAGDVILGVGEDGIVPMAQLAVGLRRLD